MAQSTPKANGVGRLDKRQIEQRIEEDRERHKRLKESIWGVDGEDDEEYQKLWDEASDIGEDDYLAAEEDAMERRQAVDFE
jgi:CTD kinase subunit gamma